MRIFTLCKSLICLLILTTLTVPEAKAQLVSSADCSYENECFLVSYESIIDDPADPENYTLVLSVIFNDRSQCTTVQGMTFATADLNIITRTKGQLTANGIVEIKVDRDVYLSAPTVVVTAFYYINFRGLRIPVPSYVINLQTKLDSGDPCIQITPLPVELISFKGAASRNGIELAWETASEKDNSHFEVERSADGSAFEQVGNVKGHGNSSTKISYRFTDDIPLPGQNYYRLKQVDYNGQHEYSRVISVRAAETGTDEIQLTLYPNPCQNGDCQLSIRNTSGSKETRLELTDLAGRVLYTTTVQHANGRTITVPMQELQTHKGLYIITAISGNKVVRQRVVLD